MNEEIAQKFDRMGARVKFVRTRAHRTARQWNGKDVGDPGSDARRLSIDVRNDERGPYFEITRRSDVSLKVLDVRPKDRHLLLFARAPGARHAPEIRGAFLCGFDERSWFVAAIPEAADATDVQAARDALKPKAVWDAMREFDVPMEDRDRRRTAAFIRQGEWFFIPRRHLDVHPYRVLHNEPIRRGAGKPHLCQFLYRIGGEQVYVNHLYPNGVTLQEFRDLPEAERSLRWRPMTRDPRAFVRGKVSHPDHETIHLDGWHEVVMNTETQSQAMRDLAFVD